MRQDEGWGGQVMVPVNRTEVSGFGVRFLYTWRRREIGNKKRERGKRGKVRKRERLVRNNFNLGIQYT